MTTTHTTPPAAARAGNIGSARWIGAAAGISIAAVDTLTMRALGISFAMNGRDVGLLVGATFGSSLAGLGFLLGWVIDGRRRDREQSRVIAAQHEAIEAARARLVQSEKLAALGQLGATIAHEVRNPLAVIRSAAQNLGEGVAAGDADGRRACQFITAEIDRLTSVVGSLLAFARPIRIEPRPVAVAELFDDALLLAGPELARRQVHVLRPPAADTALQFQADADLVRQVLVGLLSNAIEAAGSGGEVALAARRRDDVMELEVADSGPGVPTELRARIFEPFFTTRARGTGLGLPIARQIVEAHGGRLEVGERQGGGARFLVRLPATPRAAIAA